MSMLARATRAVKAIDQVGLSDVAALRYIPLENHQSWTEYATPIERNYIAVYQCVRVLSNTFAQLPLKLYRRRPGGGKDEATDHPLYRVLHLAPNPEMTSFVWRKIAMRHLATWGNHYSEIAYDQFGRPQLWPISPERIEVRWNGGRREYIHTSAAGVRMVMRPGSVFHMQGQTTDGLTGSSPVADLRKTLGLAQAAGRFASAVFDNGARPGTVITHPKTLGTPAQERLIAQMEDLKGSSSANKTVLLEEGMTVTPIGFPPEDAMFLETQLNQHRLIYGAYGIPPHKVGDLERATFSNIEHQALEYIQDGAMPWFVNAEQEFAVQLIPEDDVFAEFLVDGYLRGDAKSRAEALQIRLINGTLTQDEWRSLENENPLPDGLGSHTWMAANYAPVSATLAPPEPVAEPLPPEIPSVPDILAAASKSAGDQVMRIVEESMAAQERMGNRHASTLVDALKSVAERPIQVDIKNDTHIDEGAVVVHAPVNVPAPKAVKAAEPRAVRKTVERDDAGHITAVLEEPV